MSKSFKIKRPDNILNESKSNQWLSQQQEPPFLLYKNVNSPSIDEGLDSIVNLLKDRKNIAVLLGAGISVSCGIPDFRTKGSGLYSTLDAEVSVSFRFLSKTNSSKIFISILC